MFSAYDLGAAVALPCGLTALVVFAGWRLTRRRLAARASRTWTGPLATAAGFVAGYAATAGWPALPPGDSLGWLIWLALAVAALGTQIARHDQSTVLPWAGALLVAPLGIWLLAGPLVRQSDAVLGPVVIGAAVMLGVAGLASGELLAERSSAARLAGIQGVSACLSGATLAVSGSLHLAQLATVLAATQLGCVLAHGALGRAGQGRGTALIFSTLHGGLLWYAYMFAALNSASAVACWLAPQAAWLAHQSPRQFSRWRRVIAQLALVALTACAALAWAWHLSPADAIDPN